MERQPLDHEPAESLERDSVALDAMVRDYEAGPEIFLPSKFWKRLNAINSNWLAREGFGDFKRSVNNNYFNWMITAESPIFRRPMLTYLRILKNHPRLGLDILRFTLRRMRYRTLVKDSLESTLLEKFTYFSYLARLYLYVQANDAHGLFRQLEESPIGNPITLTVNGLTISQDLCNSYLEYEFLRNSLGDGFDEVQRIVELGAGYGRLSQLMYRLRGKKKLQIVIVDIPPALGISQWYLQRTCPEATFFTYRNFRDFAPVSFEFKAADFCFLLPHQLELLPERYADLLINISSLHEMTAPQINRYYELIDEKARLFYTKQWMFWKNPDDQIPVPAIAYPTRPHWSLIAARVNPIHPMFFEALFRVSGAGPSMGSSE